MMSQSTAFLALLVVLVSMEFSNAVTPNSCMQNPTTYSPNATNCADVRETAACRAIFTASTPTVRDPKCVNPSLEEFALECANTCGLCCETPAFTCGDDPVSPINCTANTRYCDDDSWTTVMQQYCPGTCGLCTNAAATCRDINTGCLNMRPLCNDINFNTYMRANCQRTCMFCSSAAVTTTTTASPATCSDVATNCATNAALCNNSAYLTLMTQKCPRTCNRCTGVVPAVSATCVNANANCASWVANGFCGNTFYTTAQKRSFCARSCNLC